MSQTNAHNGSPDMSVPNTVMDGDGFFVSYNDRDEAIYGSDTTALVQGQMERFYILDGDHRVAYAALIPEGFEACMGYFVENIDRINMHSEKPEPAAGIPFGS